MADILSHEPSDDDKNKVKDLVTTMQKTLEKAESLDVRTEARMNMIRAISDYKYFVYNNPHNDYLIILKTELFDVLSEKINNISWDDIVRRSQRTGEGEEGVITDDDNNSKLYLRKVQTCLNFFHDMIRMSDGMDYLQHLTEFNDLKTTYITLVNLVDDLTHKMDNTVGGQRGGAPPLSLEEQLKSDKTILDQIESQAQRSLSLLRNQIVHRSIGLTNIPQITDITISQHVRDIQEKHVIIEGMVEQEPIDEGNIPAFSIKSLRIYPESRTFLRDYVRRENAMIHIMVLIQELQNSLNTQVELLTGILPTFETISHEEPLRTRIQRFRIIQDIYHDMYVFVLNCLVWYNNSLVPRLYRETDTLLFDTSLFPEERLELEERVRSLNSIAYFFAGIRTIERDTGNNSSIQLVLEDLVKEIYDNESGNGLWNILNRNSSVDYPIRIHNIESGRLTDAETSDNMVTDDEEAVQRGGRPLNDSRVPSPFPLLHEEEVNESSIFGNLPEDEGPLNDSLFSNLSEIAPEQGSVNDSLNISAITPIHEEPQNMAGTALFAPVINEQQNLTAEEIDERLARVGKQLTALEEFLKDGKNLNGLEENETIVAIVGVIMEEWDFFSYCKANEIVWPYHTETGRIPANILEDLRGNLINKIYSEDSIFNLQEDNFLREDGVSSNVIYPLRSRYIEGVNDDDYKKILRTYKLINHMLNEIDWNLEFEELLVNEDIDRIVRPFIGDHMWVWPWSDETVTFRFLLAESNKMLDALIESEGNLLNRTRSERDFEEDEIHTINEFRRYNAVGGARPNNASSSVATLIPPDDISQDLRIITEYYDIREELSSEESVVIDAFRRVLNAILQHGQGETRDSMLVRVNREVFKVSDEISPHHFIDYTSNRRGELINTMNGFKTAWRSTERSTESPNDRLFTRAFEESYQQQLKELLQ